MFCTLLTVGFLPGCGRPGVSEPGAVATGSRGALETRRDFLIWSLSRQSRDPHPTSPKGRGEKALGTDTMRPQNSIEFDYGGRHKTLYRDA